MSCHVASKSFEAHTTSSEAGGGGGGGWAPAQQSSHVNPRPFFPHTLLLSVSLLVCICLSICLRECIPLPFTAPSILPHPYPHPPPTGDTREWRRVALPSLSSFSSSLRAREERERERERESEGFRCLSRRDSQILFFWVCVLLFRFPPLPEGGTSPHLSPLPLSLALFVCL